ncbi:MAG: hypothetical protein ACJAXX_003359 [Roseivirga sp.]|jgi:hypothetical protein
MIFDDQQFSKEMKNALISYLEDRNVDFGWSRAHLEMIQLYPLDQLKRDEEKLAFWINVYNGLTIYFIIKFRLQKTVRELPSFFTELRVNIGGSMFALDDIEHGILRRNRPRINRDQNQFQLEEKRLKSAPNKFDPRIHFTLNCGGLSCPPIAFYQSDRIEEQLQSAEMNFVAQEFLVNSSQKELTCSSIFVWYRNDFDQTYLDNPEFKGFSIKEKTYNWDFV